MNTAFGFSEPLVADTPLPFPDQCAKIHDRIAAFLDKKHVSDRVKSVQQQTRIALGVIDEALGQYRWVAAAMAPCGGADTSSGYQSSRWPTMEERTVLSS